MITSKSFFSATIPIVLFIVLLFAFLNYGPLGVLKSEFPPIEEIFIERFVLEPEQIYIHIINDGPEPVTISQLTVNEVFWQFQMQPGNKLKPLEKGVIKLNYPWVEGNPYGFNLFASDGVTFEGEIGVATATPKINRVYLKTFILLGIYVGVIPVLLGLLWYPFLRRLKGEWFGFLLSLTIGLLLFLGFDTLEEAFELIGDVPEAFNGFGVLIIGFFLAILALSYISFKTENFKANKGDQIGALIWGYFISLGIGFHNLGEGLAIGSAYAIGEIALGSTLVIGFMTHNLTEGIAIVAPLTRVKIKSLIVHLIVMGLIAGGPTIIGSLIGGFSYSPIVAILFLAIGAGAIFDVSFDILNHMAKGKWLSLFTLPNVAGFFLGFLIIYFTGFLVI